MSLTIFTVPTVFSTSNGNRKEGLASEARAMAQSSANADPIESLWFNIFSTIYESLIFGSSKEFEQIVDKTNFGSGI